MKYSYYPGCTLCNKAKSLDDYARASALKLGFELEEIENWQCCGGVYPLSYKEIGKKLPSVRALAAARDKGQKLVTLCSACYNVIKRVNEDMKTNPILNMVINNYLALDKPYNGECEVLHYIEVLRDEVGFDKVRQAVTNPLADRKVGAYYGCLLLRPSEVLQFDDPENPTVMEQLLEALGATPAKFADRNECCGGYISLNAPEQAAKNCNNIMNTATISGAECLVTACPLCQFNLSRAEQLPVYYFTELLAEALGIKEAQ